MEIAAWPGLDGLLAPDAHDLPHLNLLPTSRFGVSVAALFLLALPAAAAAERPSASFSFSPGDPRADRPVRFESSSCDPDGRLASQAWDLDGDGAYNDATGAVVSKTFASTGPHEVGLRVTSRDGATDARRRTVVVDTEYALPRPDQARLMSPFPVVRLAGELIPNGARIGLLAVRAPVCARAAVSCSGNGCPKRRRQTKFVGRGRLRFPRFETRLREGSVLAVRISKANLIGKITRFSVRIDRSPKRMDKCLRPGDSKGSPCPED